MSPPPAHFERLSFWDLLNRHSVQIPVIQRDYAQGRKSKGRVLDGLLNALLASFDGKAAELDFVFGDVKNGQFRPLDGQQRLTTLFLLHWYAARAAGLSSDFYAATLGRFSYDTRVSSRDFCRRLVQEELLIGDSSLQKSLSWRIRDLPWFVGSWQFDPTVDGMLASLDRISELPWPEDLWKQLTAGEASPIRFLLVKLEEFGLSDDLYIKMNARGKPLTAFETFKALLGERVVNEGWEDNLNPKAKFAIRVDTRWTDFFWHLCPEEASGLRRIDGAFLSFIVHSLACSMALHAAAAGEVAKALQSLLNDYESVEADDFSETFYGELRDQLERLSEDPDAVANEVRCLWEFSDSAAPSENSIMREVIQATGPQYRLRLILYAQLKLHEKTTGVSQDAMSDWRRLVRNLLAHTTIESPEDFVAGIRLLDELAEGITSIHEFLASTEIRSGFSSKQVTEEQRKARLLVRQPEQKELLHRLEDTYFLRGRISFALDCVSEDQTAGDLDFKRLADVASVIETEFEGGISPEIRRAFFTVGDGGFFRYWRSWFYAKDLPKYCLISDDRDFRNFAEIHHPSREALKSFVLKLIGKNCTRLIEEYRPEPGTPNWRIRLIRESDLIGRATGHYIALDEEGGVVYPIPGIRPHDNSATRTYLEENKIE